MNKARLIEAAALGITKELMDKGKLIEAGFAAFRHFVMVKDAPPDQVKEMRLAFMAGAEHLFSSIMGILDPGDEPSAADLRRMDLINTEIEFRPALAMRIWKRLGFRYGAYCGRPDDDEARYTVHRIFTNWDWRDRLRILVSGQTETELCVETETLESLKGVRQAAVVLAPGLRFESGTPRG